MVRLPTLQRARLSRIQHGKFNLIICACVTVLLILCSLKQLSYDSGHFVLTGFKLLGAPEIVLARVLSNSLPPLHSINQTVFNLRTILSGEKLPREFERMWVINCIVSPEERKQIILLLDEFDQTYVEISLSNSTSVQTIREEVLNVNKARNTAIRKSFSLFEPDWILLWDGSQFMTRESAETIKTMINSQEGYSIFFTPMYRLIHNVVINSSWTFNQIYPHLSGLQEPLIAISRKFYRQEITDGTPFFDEDKLYGNENKLSKLRDLKKSGHPIGCEQALWGNGFGNPKRGMGKESEVVSECGFALRLLYKPSPNADFDQEHTIWNNDRGDIRGKAKRLLLDKLKAYVESNHHVSDEWADEYAAKHDQMVEIKRAKDRELEQQKLEDARKAQLRELKENFKQYVKLKQKQQANPKNRQLKPHK